jgi:hypothetical protein
MAVVRGRSMEPALHEGDRMLVLYGARPRRRRMVLVRLPDGPDGPRPLAVKRIGWPDLGGADAWWVVSDNAREGVDSRVFGTIPSAQVLALVLCRIPRRPRWLSRRAP